MNPSLLKLLAYDLRVTFDPDATKSTVIVQVCKPRTESPPFTWSESFTFDAFAAEFEPWCETVVADYVKEWL